MEKWKCAVCGYIYDQKNGDFDTGFMPGTPFFVLSSCPACGADKKMFEKL